MLSPKQQTEVKRALYKSLRDYKTYIENGAFAVGFSDDDIVDEALAAISAVMEQSHIVAGNKMGSTGVATPSQSDEPMRSSKTILSLHIGYEDLMLFYTDGSSESIALSERCQKERQEQTDAFAEAIRDNSKPPATEATEAYTPVQGDDWLDDVVDDFLHDYRQGYDNSREQGLNLEYCTYDTIAGFMAAVQAQLDDTKESSYKQGFSDGQDSFLDHGFTNLGDSDPANNLYTQAQLNEAVREALRPFAKHQDSCKTLEAFYAQRGQYKDPRDCFDYLCDCGGAEIIERLEQLTNQSKPKENG